MPLPGWLPAFPFLHGFDHIAAGHQIDGTGKITASDSASGIVELVAAFGTQLLKDVGALKVGRVGDFQQLPPYLADHMPRAYAVRVWDDLRGNS